MVNVNMMPCADCQHFLGIKQPDGTEKTEYVACEIAQSLRAENLLQFKARKFTCAKQLPFED